MSQQKISTGVPTKSIIAEATTKRGKVIRFVEVWTFFLRERDEICFQRYIHTCTRKINLIKKIIIISIISSFDSEQLITLETYTETQVLHPFSAGRLGTCVIASLYASSTMWLISSHLFFLTCPSCNRLNERWSTYKYMSLRFNFDVHPSRDWLRNSMQSQKARLPGRT